MRYLTTTGKIAVIVLIAVVITAIVALTDSHAAPKADEWIDHGCCRSRIQDVTDKPTVNRRGEILRPGKKVGERLAIQTAKPMTKERTGAYAFNAGLIDKKPDEGQTKRMNDNLNARGATIAMRVLGQSEVTRIVIGHRELLVWIYPYPGQWDKVEPAVVKIIKKVLCKK